MTYWTLSKALTWMLPYAVRIASADVELREGLDRSGGPVSALVIKLTAPPHLLDYKHEGFGEVLPRGDLSRAEASRLLDSLALVRKWRLGEYLERVWGIASASPALAFALEIAGFDLALKHLGQGFCFPIVESDHPLRFVVSICGHAAPHEAMAEYLAADPSLEFRLVPSASWSKEVWTALEGVPQLRMLSLTGFGAQAGFHPEVIAGLAGLLGQRTDILLENACAEAREALGVRIHDLCWDDDFKSVEHIKRLARPGDYVCIKPCSLGNLHRLAEVVEFCEQASIKMYGGDQGEIGPMREQHQAIASGLYPEGPNDLAPYEYYSRPRPTGAHNPLQPRYDDKGGLRFRTLDYVDPWYCGTCIGPKIKARREELGLDMIDVAEQIGRSLSEYRDIEGGGDYFICCMSLKEAKTISRFLGLDFLTLCGLERSDSTGDESIDRWRALPRHELVRLRRDELGLSVGEVSKRAGWEDPGEWERRLIEGAESDVEYLDNEVCTGNVVELALAIELPPDLLLRV